jgi:hypothetical protein
MERGLASLAEVVVRQIIFGDTHALYMLPVIARVAHDHQAAFVAVCYGVERVVSDNGSDNPQN